MSLNFITNFSTNHLSDYPVSIWLDSCKLSCAHEQGSLEQILPQRGEPMK